MKNWKYVSFIQRVATTSDLAHFSILDFAENLKKGQIIGGSYEIFKKNIFLF